MKSVSSFSSIDVQLCVNIIIISLCLRSTDVEAMLYMHLRKKIEKFEFIRIHS